MKIAPRPFCLAFLPACLPTTLKIRTLETTFLQSLGLPHAQIPNGVAGPKELVSEPGIRTHGKAPGNSFRINTCVSVDPKKLEVLQNQRLQKTGGEGGVIVNQQPTEPSTAPPLAVLQCSEASPMATAIGSSFPASHSLLHSSNSCVSPLDATFTKNKGGGGWQELQSVSPSSVASIIHVLSIPRSQLVTLVSRTTHYSPSTTHRSFPCA
jgi:hypothetical protein